MVTREVAEFVVRTDYDALPPEVIELGKKSVLDGLGLALAGNTATAPSSDRSAGTPGSGTLSFTFGASSTDSLSVASATINGTADLLFNPAALTTPGTYTLVTSRNGTLGGAWEFAGAENMTQPVNSLMVKGNTGSSTIRAATTG